MYELIINTDKWIFLALAVIVLLLLGMVFKYVFKPEPTLIKLGGTSDKLKKDSPKNTDFFNTKRGNITKTTSIFVESENKHYFLIDMGNNKVMIMEEDIYQPEVVDTELTKQVVEKVDTVHEEAVEIAPEVSKSDLDIQNQLLEDEGIRQKTVDDMTEIVRDQHLAYNDFQKKMFDDYNNEEDLEESDEGHQNEEEQE